MRALALGILLVVGGTAPLAAQEPMEAESNDEAAIGATIDGVYRAISGPVGEPRDWDTLRSLLTEDARLTPIGAEGHRALTVDGYIERAGPTLVESGFFEIETGRRVEQYGSLAHVWSAYEGRTGGREGAVSVRGINSFQLVKHGGQWKVFSILWQPARDDLPVPADLAANNASESD